MRAVIAVLALFPLAAVALNACGSKANGYTSNGGDDGSVGDGGVFGEGGSLGEGGRAQGTFTAPDCTGCTFPAADAPPCAGPPAINVVYPNDGVLVPPNMGVLSVMWTPFGDPFTEFEVDFSNGNTDVRVITKCAKETTDTAQPPTPSGGCELLLDTQVWTVLSNANRGGNAVDVTVRGTTDGTCASKAQSSVKMSFASEDVLGAIYYWKSTVSAAGVGGQIWVKSFGDSIPEQQVTSQLNARCVGCHALSRDGQRMMIYTDDDDSDDEYGDVNGGLLDMSATPAKSVGVAAQPPGFSTFSPDHSSYASSNGLGKAPTNVFALYNGVAGTAFPQITLLAAGDRPTMPDWSPDGKSVVFVKPTQVGSWNKHIDDSHVFGGSLYTIAYNGNQQFGAVAPLLASAGENNYYPSYSPDGQYVMFDRAPHDPAGGAIDGCVGAAPQRSCPNDSFSNPAARVMLLSTGPGATPIDLEAANGSPASAPQPLSNSWPRWSPFVQTYKGSRLLWITFSSTRDYGLRVRNHKSGMYQCYPADSYEDPGSSHGQKFDAVCQQPQLWMAAVSLSTGTADPSFPAFWLPYEDITTHNHTPQWTQAVANRPPPDGGACIPNGGDCRANPSGCCSNLACGADGTCQPIVH